MGDPEPVEPPGPLLQVRAGGQAEGDVVETGPQLVERRRARGLDVLVDAEEGPAEGPDHVVEGAGVLVEDRLRTEEPLVPRTAASEVGSLLLGARGIKSVTGHKSDEMANYYAQHADQIAINKKVVSAWDEALVEKERAKRLRRMNK